MKNKPFDSSATESVITSIDKAQEVTQPFMGAGQDGTPVVVGDLNNIDAENDYVVQFLYPEHMAIQGDYEETPEGRLVTRKFSGKSISPRKARRMRHAVSTMLLYFTKVNPDTNVAEVMTVADVATIYEHLSDEIVTAMETILQHTLGISDLDMEYVTDESLVSNVGTIILNNSGFFQRNS